MRTVTETPLTEEYWSGEINRFLPDPQQALEEALGYVSCPICYVMAGVPLQYFSLLPPRWPNEPQLQESVRRRGGFCNRHTWYLHEVQSQVVIATILGPVLAEYEQHRVSGEPCPVCHLQQLAEDVLLDTFARWLDQPGAVERYQRLFGVCEHHYEQLGARSLSARARSALVTSQQQSRKRLSEDLRAFVETDKVGSRWERTEDQRKAPRRACLKTGGNEGA